jgi:hypothetical protein
MVMLNRARHRLHIWNTLWIRIIFFIFFILSLNFYFYQVSFLIAKLIANYLYLLSMNKIKKNRTNIENVLKK